MRCSSGACPWAVAILAAALAAGPAASFTHADIVSYWNFDTKAGDTIADQVSGSSHVGTLANGADITAGGLGFGGGEALQPNADGAGGTQGYMSVNDVHGDPDHYDFNGDFTWYAMVQVSSGGDAGIISRSSLTGYWNQGSKAMFMEDNGHLEWDTGWVGNSSTTTDLRDGDWHQLIAVYVAAADNLKLIVDGVAEYDGNHDVNRYDEHTKDHNGGIAHTGFAVGWTSPNVESDEFLGLIDDVAVFNEALSGDDLTTLFNDGPGGWVSDGTLTSIIDGDWHHAMTWAGDGGAAGIPTSHTIAIVGAHAPPGTQTVTVSAGNPGLANGLSILTGYTVQVNDALAVSKGINVAAAGALKLSGTGTLTAALLETAGDVDIDMTTGGTEIGKLMIGGGTFDVTGGDFPVSSLTQTGGVTTFSNGLSGDVTLAGGTGSAVDLNAENLTLTGVSLGTVDAATDFDVTGTLDVTETATVNIGALLVLDQDLSVPTLSLAGGELAMARNNLTVTTALNVSDASTFDTADVTSLTTAGAAISVLSGSTFTASGAVTAESLSIAGATATTVGAGAFSVNDFFLDTTTVAFELGRSANVTAQGGAVNLNGTNSFTGTLTVLGGTTTVNSPIPAAGGVVVNGGALATAADIIADSFAVSNGNATIGTGHTLDTPAINVSGGTLTFAGDVVVVHAGGGTVCQTGGTINAGSAVGDATDKYNVSVGNATYNAAAAGSAGLGAVTLNVGGRMNVTHGDALSDGTGRATVTVNSGGRLDLQTALNGSSRIDLKAHSIFGGDLTGLTYDAANVTLEQDVGIISTSTSLPTTDQIGAGSVLAAISGRNEIVTELGAAGSIFRGALFTAGAAPIMFSGTLGSATGVDLAVVAGTGGILRLNGATFDSGTGIAQVEVPSGEIELDGPAVGGTATTFNVIGPDGNTNSRILYLNGANAVKSTQTWRVDNGLAQTNNNNPIAGTIVIEDQGALRVRDDLDGPATNPDTRIDVQGTGVLNVDSPDRLNSLGPSQVTASDDAILGMRMNNVGVAGKTNFQAIMAKFNHVFGTNVATINGGDWVVGEGRFILGHANRNNFLHNNATDSIVSENIGGTVGLAAFNGFEMRMDTVINAPDSHYQIGSTGPLTTIVSASSHNNDMDFTRYTGMADGFVKFDKPITCIDVTVVSGGLRIQDGDNNATALTVIVKGAESVAGKLELSGGWSLADGSVTVTGQGLVDVDETDDLGSLSMIDTVGTSVHIVAGRMLMLNTLLDGGGTITGGGGLLLGSAATYSWQPNAALLRDSVDITGNLILTDGWTLEIDGTDGDISAREAVDGLDLFTVSGNLTYNAPNITLVGGADTWTGTPVVQRDGGRVYLTGLAGGTGAALVWRDGVDGDWTSVNWTGDGGANWIAPVGGEAMVVDSGIVNVSADLTTTPGAAGSLAVAGGTVNIAAAGSLAASEDVTVGAGGALNVSGGLMAATLKVDGGAVNAAEPITISDKLNIGDEPTVSVTGGSFGISGADLQDDAVPRTLTLRGGTVHLGGSGAGATAVDMSNTTISVAADSALDLDAAGGATFGGLTLGAGHTVTVNADFALADDAACDAVVSGAEAGGLIGPGTVTLGDNISLNVIPVGGDDLFQVGSYVLVSAGAVSGTFANVTPLGSYVTGNGLTYDAAGGTVTLTLELNLNPADANLDGATDVSDRIVWNNNNFTFNTMFVAGDWNNDGATDVSDRIIWNSNNFTFASAAPAGPIAAEAAPGPLPDPKFIYDFTTGVMRVEANGHFLTEIVVNGNEGASLLSAIPFQNTRGGFIIWMAQNFNGKFQAYDAASNGDSGNYDLAEFALGLDEDDFIDGVDWGSVPELGQPGGSGVSPVTIVPEPATLALLAIGGALALLRPKRR